MRFSLLTFSRSSSRPEVAYVRSLNHASGLRRPDRRRMQISGRSSRRKTGPTNNGHNCSVECALQFNKLHTNTCTRAWYELMVTLSLITGWIELNWTQIRSLRLNRRKLIERLKEKFIEKYSFFFFLFKKKTINWLYIFVLFFRTNLTRRFLALTIERWVLNIWIKQIYYWARSIDFIIHQVHI